MKQIKNPEFYKVGGDKTITVAVTFDISPKASESEILVNAAEAIKFYRDNKVHKSWERFITIK